MLVCANFMQLYLSTPLHLREKNLFLLHCFGQTDLVTSSFPDYNFSHPSKQVNRFFNVGKN